MATSRPIRFRNLWVFTLVLPVLLAAVACTGQTPSGKSHGDSAILYHDPHDRPKAPKLSGDDLDGKPLNAKLADKVVVVNFWASWCAPCRREGPALVSAAKDADKSAVTFIGINIRDDADKASAFEKSLHVNYPSIFDPSGRLALQFSDVPPNTIPATIVIDRSGRVAAVFREELKASTLNDAIADVTNG